MQTAGAWHLPPRVLGIPPVKGFPSLIQGVKLVFYDSKADVLLLEIPEPIPDKFQPYMMGFDASADAVPRHAVSIHHPNGGVKRISYANDRWACRAARCMPPAPSGLTPEQHDAELASALLSCSGSISTNFTAYTFPRGEVQPTDASHFKVSSPAGDADQTACMHTCLRLACMPASSPTDMLSWQVHEFVPS